MELKFDEYLAGRGPSVQERWIGPWRPDKSFSEISEDDEDGENEQEEEHEEPEEPEEPEEEEHKDVGHEPSSILLLIFKRLWNTGTIMLKKLVIWLRQKLSEYRWILPFCKKDGHH